MKLFILFLGLFFVALGFAQEAKTIGIVLPLDHVALRAIVQGFQESVAKNYHGAVTYQIENAQSDMNLQHAIIQKFINEKVDLIVPLGESTTEMTAAMVKTQPIISLASDFSEADRMKRSSKAITGVHDELKQSDEMDFLKTAIPSLHTFTIIYSNSDTIIPQVEKTEVIAKANHIQMQKLVITNLSDLYTISAHIDPKSQAIYILKDNMVVSGISTLIHAAKKMNIPLITSDEGTVSIGACAALGAIEKQIGLQGGKLAADFFNGKPLATMPIEELAHYSIFINRPACQGVALPAIETYAKQQKYSVLEVTKSIMP